MRLRGAVYLWLLAAIPACSGDPEDDDTADDDAADDDAADDDVASTLTLSDSQNYDFEGTLDIRPYDLADGSDPLFDWSGLDTDLQGHPLDPVTDVDQVTIVVFRYLSEGEVEEKLSSNTLEQVDVGLFASVDPGDATSVRLSELTLMGNDIDVEQYFVEGYGTWLVSLATGSTPGVGTRMAAFARPLPSEAETTLTFAADSTVLDFTVDLASLDPLPAPAGVEELTVDWSGVGTDGLGNAFQADSIDRVMVGQYTSLAPADLEEQFLDLEILADSLWRLDVSGGTEAALGQAAGDAPFPGFDSAGTWVLALQCTTCANPAPPFLTLVEAQHAAAGEQEGAEVSPVPR
ncbi:hypothetical protein L6R50_04685 [Myxococcota bacterium]|nr:hypothetical protein [Myxococcota bacterium]